MAITGFIFDVDGTLIDSNDAHARAFVEAFAENDRAVSFETVRKLIGMGSDKLIPAAGGVEQRTALFETIAQRKKEIFKEQYLHGLRAFPKVKNLLYALHRRNVRLATASSADPDELTQLLKLTGAAELFETKTSSGDAEESKPDPDIVEAAMEKLALPANQLLMIGDTPYDVEAASRAGIAIIALRCGGWSDKELSGAIRVLDEPAQLLAELDSVFTASGASEA